MKRIIIGALALCAVGAAVLASTPATAQERGYGSSWEDANAGYGERRYRSHNRYSYGYRNRRTPMGGRNPSGCYYDDGGGRRYSCDAGGRR